ncbi:sigma-70 family RNA polymerase sigma factor [Aureisphaera galaxeae]|uniref:RNA polymerase sigma factor n=1 Tax=Aureisphaera galaxeae TaxID=1538023 RepID=UPI002351054A|nr:sigma-70 family RNA polymerase sigma factor [Aureisphaera galaxeae]MDC8003717.1 sigma-70 family RNA polymerase sigma factor [Aureisphaera galaxeae]
MEPKLIDHLFRHHYGKMVSVLTRIFGLAHIETIEDAVQDAFVKATVSWTHTMPDNPEAWLTQAAKNRVLDIFRKLKTHKKHVPQLSTGPSAIALSDLFLDTEIEDSQLRMIFTACHPQLDPRDRIAFALKTVSGFSIKEIASALLTKEDSIKKRIQRARKAIKKKDIRFAIPQGKELPERNDSVLEVVYLIFNEGFHSNRKDMLVRKDLCGEALRLCQLILKREATRSPEGYALLALMCFHAARLDSKINDANEIIDLRHQDRSKWHFPLVKLGNHAMVRAVEDDVYSHYHYEAAIAAEHIKARSFEETNWEAIFKWYEALYAIQPSPSVALNMVMTQIQRGNFEDAKERLQQIEPADLEQRSYLYYGTYAEYYQLQGERKKAVSCMELALLAVQNDAERKYLERKKEALLEM